MQAKKLKFSQDALRAIFNLCELTFNLHHDKELENLFGITPKQIKEIIKKITNELPNIIFDLPPQKLEEIKNIFAREFIFFQVQEKGTEPHYQEDLSKFSRIFSRDIKRQITSQASAEE